MQKIEVKILIFGGVQPNEYPQILPKKIREGTGIFWSKNTNWSPFQSIVSTFFDPFKA